MNQRPDTDTVELIKKLFVNSDEVLSDIAHGEDMLTSNPAPLPDKALLTRISSAMAEAYSARQKQQHRAFIWRAAVLAASAILIVATTLLTYDRLFFGDEPSIISAEFWEQAQLPGDAIIDAQFAQLQDTDVFAVVPLDTGSHESLAVTEVESEFDDTVNSFWEG